VTVIKLTIIISLTVITLGMSAIYSWVHSRADDHIPLKCTASVVIFHPPFRANLTLDFMYNQENKTGLISVSGNVNEKNKRKGTVRRDVLFTWTEKYNTYKMSSTKIIRFDNIDTLTDDFFARILPDFYVYPNNPLTYSFINQGRSGFMIAIGKRPLFFCSR
jgi:hypothetical protein